MMLVYALLPSSIIVTSVTLREPYQLLLVNLAILAALKIYWNKSFQRAEIFQKAYLTDLIQELVDIGIKVHCVIIESGWKEIDTVEDYKKALVGFNKKFTKI